MDDEEETPEKARAGKAAAESPLDLLPIKKRMKFQIRPGIDDEIEPQKLQEQQPKTPGTDEIDRPTPLEQMTAIDTSDRDPPSDRGGGRREGLDTPPVRESSNKEESQRGVGVAKLERLKLQMEEKRKKNLQPQSGPRIDDDIEPQKLGIDEIKSPTRQEQMTAIAISDRPPPSPRGVGRREDPGTPLVRESSNKKKKEQKKNLPLQEIAGCNRPKQEVPLLQRFIKIAEIERRRLQMEEERKKKKRGITASNRLNQVAPQSKKRISELERLRLQFEDERRKNQSSNMKKEQKKNLPLQEITGCNRPKQEMPLLQRFIKIAVIERRRLQMEEERKKKNRGITASNHPNQVTHQSQKRVPQMYGSGPVDEETRVIDSHGLGVGGVRTVDWRRSLKPLPLKLDHTEIIEMWSDRGSIYIDGVGLQTVPVYETASGGADDAVPRSQRFMQIGDLERLRLQMEERKKSLGINDVELPLQEITASNRPMQVPELPSSQNMRRIVPVDRSDIHLQGCVTTSNYPVQMPRSLELSSSQDERRLVPVNPSKFRVQCRESGSPELSSSQNERQLVPIGRSEFCVQMKSGRQITTSNHPVQAPRSMELCSRQKERQLVPVDRSEFHVQTRLVPQVTASNRPVQAPRSLELSSSQNEKRLVLVPVRCRRHVQMNGSGVEKTNFIDLTNDSDSPIHVSTSKPCPPGDDPTVGSTGDAQKKYVYFFLPDDELRRRILRLHPELREEQQKNPRNDEIEPSDQPSPTDHISFGGGGGFTPWRRERRVEAPIPVRPVPYRPFPIQSVPIRTIPIRPVPIRLVPSQNRTDDERQRLPLQEITVDRFWQNLQGVLWNQNDGALVVSDQTVRIAERYEEPELSSPEDQTQPRNTE